MIPKEDPHKKNLKSQEGRPREVPGKGWVFYRRWSEKGSLYDRCNSDLLENSSIKGMKKGVDLESKTLGGKGPS